MSGFLSEKVGRLKITQKQWEDYLASLDDDAQERAVASTVFHLDPTHGKPDEGHLDANVCMMIGKAHASELHKTGYWCGDDVYIQLNHAITIFEILHPNCKGLFLFDNSTGHSKMAVNALLAQNMNLNPGGKYVSKQRETTYDSDGAPVVQSFVFKAGDALLFKAEGVHVVPLDPHGDIRFPSGMKVKVQRSSSKVDATVVSRQEDGTYTVRVEAPGAAALEELAGVVVSSITVSAETFEPGPIDARLIGQSKGIKQILLERGLITASTKLNATCGAVEKNARKAAKAEKGIAKGESVDVPLHAGCDEEGEACCLTYLISEQPDFKGQQNAIHELILSRGHLCIFLPKFHPELNFIERYWSRVKWYARKNSDGTVKGMKATADMALGEEACDLALIRRYARTSWRWVGAYDKGLDGVLACWAVRKSKCHRCVTDAVDREVNLLVIEKEKAARERAGVEAPPLVLAGVADMGAVGALGDDDGDD